MARSPGDMLAQYEGAEWRAAAAPARGARWRCAHAVRADKGIRVAVVLQACGAARLCSGRQCKACARSVLPRRAWGKTMRGARRVRRACVVRAWQSEGARRVTGSRVRHQRPPPAPATCCALVRPLVQAATARWAVRGSALQRQAARDGVRAQTR